MGLPDSATRTGHFGRYESIARVATGGMGTVFLCRARAEGGFNRLFTVKVLHEHLSSDPEFVAMMQREARIAARLHHPNIVNIVDVGSERNAFYIVMDYVEGCTLADLLNCHLEYRPPAVIVAVLLEALSGLHAAHELADDDGNSLNLVHRDLSPENMLIGVDGHCRLIDFGMARAADPARFTRPGAIKGKPGYMSPEHVSGAALDRRSDLFSLGVVLFNALTGRRLFDGPSPHATMYNVLKRRIPKPSQVGLHPPACFDGVCSRALQRDPARRFQSAEEMAQVLRAAALSADLLGTAPEVAELVNRTFGEKLEQRRQKTRAYLRVHDSGSRSQLTALPEITLMATGLQPASALSDLEQQQLLTWDDLSHASPEPALAVAAAAGSVGESAAGAEPSGEGARSGKSRTRRAAVGLLALVVATGGGYFYYPRLLDYLPRDGDDTARSIPEKPVSTEQLSLTPQAAPPAEATPEPVIEEPSAAEPVEHGAPGFVDEPRATGLEEEPVAPPATAQQEAAEQASAAAFAPRASRPLMPRPRPGAMLPNASRAPKASKATPTGPAAAAESAASRRRPSSADEPPAKVEQNPYVRAQ